LLKNFNVIPIHEVNADSEKLEMDDAAQH